MAFYVEGERLFRYDAVSEIREALTGTGSGVQGVIGASEDGAERLCSSHWRAAGRERERRGRPARRRTWARESLPTEGRQRAGVYRDAL